MRSRPQGLRSDHSSATVGNLFRYAPTSGENIFN